MKDGQTALFPVVMRGQGCVDLVEKMVQQGANLNTQDAVSILNDFQTIMVTLYNVCPCSIPYLKDGWSPLMRAVEAGSKEMVEALLRVQCDVEIQEDVRVKAMTNSHL